MLRACLALIVLTFPLGGAIPAFCGLSGGGGPLTPADRERGAPSLKDLARDLGSPESDKRRRAIARLGDLGGRRAFDLVLAALADGNAEAADEAQLVLPAFEASLGTKRVVVELLGREGLRSRSALVRQRAAEAVGRLAGPLEGGALLDRLERRDAGAARMLLWSLERLASGSRLADHAALRPRLDRLLKGRLSDPVRAAAIQASVALSPGDLPPDALSDPRGDGPEAQASRLLAFVRVANETGDASSARIRLRAELRSDHANVRGLAIQLASRLQVQRAELEVLVARLDEEPRLALREQLLAQLRSLTNLKHPARVDAWTRALQGLPADWAFDPAGEATASAQAQESKGHSTASLQRLDPGSDRLAVLVDFSGSLWNERKDGTCRKDLLDPEIARLLDRLGRGSRFWLIPYTAETHPLTKTSVVANRRSLVAAKRSFEGARMRGQGNLFGAFELALEDPETDRMLIYTDGAPTGGERWNVDLMRTLMLERTRFRPVVLDFVLLDAPRPLERKWTALCEQTGGRALALRLED